MSAGKTTKGVEGGWTNTSTYELLTEAYAISGQALLKMNGLTVTPEEEPRLRSVHSDVATAHELLGYALMPYRLDKRAWLYGGVAWLFTGYGVVAALVALYRRARRGR